jgi:hypothetical protein
MAGIDTQQERSIFEYRPDLERDVPPPGRPIDPDLLSDGRVLDPQDEVMLDRGRILQDALENDELIDEVGQLLDEQIAGLDIPAPKEDRPELSWAIEQLGGLGRIDRDLYKKALDILHNAALASMCMDPVQLVFAQQSEDGPRIPNVPTRIVTCEEASDPNLFRFEGEITETLGLDAAIDQRDQMSRFDVLKLTWFGLIQFILKAILRLVERVIRALRRTFILRPIARVFKKIAKWLRGLICWSEMRTFGRHLSGFCKKGKTDKNLGFEDDIDSDVGSDRKLCFTTDDEGVDTTETPEDVDCLEDDTGSEPPQGRGCPVIIPAECTTAAQKIVDAVHKWGIEQTDDNDSGVNPAAIMMFPIFRQIEDLSETGKFALVSQDNSALSDRLKDNTNRRDRARNRWNHPLVQDMARKVRPRRVEYAADPQNPDTPDVESERC